MKRKNKIYTVGILILSGLLSGCSLMPYKSEFSCEKGKNSGICDSVSNNYKYVNERKDRTFTQEETQEIYIESTPIDFEHCYDKVARSYCITGSCGEVKRNLLEECIENTKKDFLASHNLSFKTINKLLSYQHLENERLRQKLELEYGAHHE
jgi:hypothetical protein